MNASHVDFTLLEALVDPALPPTSRSLLVQIVRLNSRAFFDSQRQPPTTEGAFPLSRRVDIFLKVFLTVYPPPTLEEIAAPSTPMSTYCAGLQ
ncbi:hypothetical protein K458DRAFT_420798 [Lentithecium fluviatile CBS 122367]|uniref:Uncharacterized protein n=1 Tax=Lentithecium fluviatile CBS 122367 TaxID=1168545 RepID=A0A6G1ITU9_9PLEO|nr:hypothetical protein K458DRAFT_420798 [Lentithecium fluviatile CBS 122367]